MLFRPSDLPEERRAAFEAFAEDVREATFDRIEAMLRTPSPAVGQATYEIAFDANDVLPKRRHRPQLRPAVLAVTAADAHDLDDAHTDALLGFTVAIQEYFDLLDDVVDGDVEPGHEREVLLATQVLLPLAVAELAELGTDAVTYWSERTLEVVAAPHAEFAAEEPSYEAYDDVLERQSALYGFVTGLAAVAAGQPDADVERAEALGRTVYRHAQLVLDYEQWATADDDDPWNAAALAGTETVREDLQALRERVEAATEQYPDPAASRFASLVALDVDAWVRSIEGA